MKTIREALVCIGCVFGGACLASVAMVAVGILWHQSYGIEGAVSFFETARIPVGILGGVLGALIFLRGRKLFHKGKQTSEP